eukprot:TRINITY_DN67497_c0_g1_i1.p1 TRINITY_DN67497_c0_g1~~TRINITY_DN67497_c0_g1_i1.p1  ORF type:complete len:639 (-),score=107.93 TRINITY_DN67497_c0_g1_i1:105-2021(-)
MTSAVVGAQVPARQIAPAPQHSMQHQMAMEQQQAVMSMAMAAAAGMCGAHSTPVEPTPAPPLTSQTAVYPPGVDPGLAQAYAQIFTQYLQQACANGADPMALAQAAAAVSASAAAATNANLNMNLAGRTVYPQHALPTYAPPLASPLSSTVSAIPPFPTYTNSMMTPPSTQTVGLGQVPLPPALSVQGSHIISMSVEGMRYQYQLSDDDLQKVFSRYGTVLRIHVDPTAMIAHIIYEHFASAQAAVQDLNGKVLKGLDGKLKIAHVPQAAPRVPSMPPLLGLGNSVSAAPTPSPWPLSAFPLVQPAPTQFSAPTPIAPAEREEVVRVGTNVAQHMTVPVASSTSCGAVTSDAKPPPHVKGVRKYTCRFLIGIESDKEFHVVRRIIGQNGQKMKRIFSQTDAKLRLRGKGSGYFEGANHKESSESLQLCISCTSPSGYKAAVTLAEELLEEVYAEYRSFCKETGKPEKEQLRAARLVASARGHYVHSANIAPSPPRSVTAGDSSDSCAKSDDDDCDDEDEGTGEADASAALDGSALSPSKKDGGRRRSRRTRGGRAARGGEGRSRGAKVSSPCEPPAKAPPVNEIEQYIDQRNEARRQCNFTEADRIRQLLHERGVALMDEPGARGRGTEVTTWRYWHE